MKKIFPIIIIATLLVGGVVIGKYTGVISPAQTHLETSPTTPEGIPTEGLLDPSGQTPALTNAPWKIEVVATNLFVPWSIVFTSPTRMLVSERNGNVQVIENGKKQEQPIHTFSQVKTEQEEGLMGMTADPDYTNNRYLYVVYAYPNGKAYTDTVVRFTDKGDHFDEEKTLLDGIPAAKVHAGSRIKFGPDKKLYITTGDATNKALPQDIHALGGKILRINNDGTIPSDNPFPGSPVWTYGHRNPQGLAWNPISGTLIETEHGPSGFDGPLGGDEVNVIEKGSNYGWPVVSHKEHKDGMVDPLLVFTPAVAPAAGLFYTGNVFPQWKNHFFFAMLKGEGIMHVVFDSNDPKKILQFEKVSNINVGRIRELAQGPDGNIYFSTSNEDGRGNAKNGDDKIYRIVKQ
ncbi:MAG: PQQ-dependent sugar dehydrogenase [Candidatus Woesebacteria bacterium]